MILKRLMPAVLGVAAAVAAGASGYSAEETLANYWPLGANQHSWDMIGHRQKDVSSPLTLMTVTNKTLDKKQFELWFSNKGGQIDGQADVERYFYCANPDGNPWLFLSEYIDAKAGKVAVEHPVISTRILFTPKGGKTFDLIENGTYARCGAKGQPYLFWNVHLESYRIQVWGYLTENPKFKWFWDATVTKPMVINNDCLKGNNKRKAIRVQEAWWSTFGAPNGKWGLGSGDRDSAGLPTGSNVTYGRSVWHAEGQLPYFLTGAPDGTAIDWCTRQIR